MFHESAFLCKCFIAYGANKRSISSMCSNVVFQNQRGSECFITVLAPELGYPSVYDHGMALQVGERRKATVAFVAFVSFAIFSFIILAHAHVHVAHSCSIVIQSSSTFWTL